MSTNPRQQKHFKRKLITYILLLGILGLIFFFLSTFFISRNSLFISPIGSINIDLNHVKEILKDNNVLFSEVSLYDYCYLVNIQNNGQVKLSQNKDIEKQISSLQRILIQLTIEGKPFKSIDFRFSEPIISF